MMMILELQIEECDQKHWGPSKGRMPKETPVQSKKIITERTGNCST